MPIEIKELHIKINVDDNQQTNATSTKEPGQMTDKVIRMCVEQMMQIETRKNER
ncbi:DUF5908 family protein [Ulvibacter antarcticus]|uniref:Uncharacterized protein n=1 Tax=Ulvibacter antarcticus TaxID=442714 RepID=A0A3L9YDZ1_9FLAO|nr:DUF5908 family protein [Ulvibacter antarcticus]RMA58871.1 hypothetical protein BXY75_2251 [Ulvibacter antarcticus]